MTDPRNGEKTIRLKDLQRETIGPGHELYEADWLLSTEKGIGAYTIVTGGTRSDRPATQAFKAVIQRMGYIRFWSYGQTREEARANVIAKWNEWKRRQMNRRDEVNPFL